MRSEASPNEDENRFRTQKELFDNRKKVDQDEMHSRWAKVNQALEERKKEQVEESVQYMKGIINAPIRADGGQMTVKGIGKA